MVACSSSMRVIGYLNLSHACGVLPTAMLAAKGFAGVAPGVDLRECTIHSSPEKANKADPTLALKRREDVTRKPKRITTFNLTFNHLNPAVGESGGFVVNACRLGCTSRNDVRGANISTVGLASKTHEYTKEHNNMGGTDK